MTGASSFAPCSKPKPAQGRRVLPECVRELEAWIESWATEYGLLPARPTMEHWARWQRTAESEPIVQVTASGTQTLRHSPDGSFVIQVTPDVSGPLVAEVDLSKEEEVVGEGPDVSQSFRDQVRLILEILDPDVAAWWASNGFLRSRDASSWFKFLLFNYYSEQKDRRLIAWVDMNFTPSQAAEAILADAHDVSSSAGQLYRVWRAARGNTADEFASWQEEAKSVSAQQAAALASIYYGSLASLTPGGDIVVTVHDIGEDGFNWSQLISALPLLAAAGKLGKASLSISIVSKGSKVNRLLQIPNELLIKLGKLSKKARNALVAKARRVKNEKEALKILEEGVSGAGARQNSGAEGTYLLRQPKTRKVMKTGRSGRLAGREKDRARAVETRDLEFEVDRYTDDYSQQRGREQIIVLAMGLKPSPSGETFRFFVC